MFNKINFRLIYYAFVVIVVCVLGFIILRAGYEVASPPNSHPAIKQYKYFLTGETKVTDSEKDELLFIYLDDPHVYPIKIERKDDRHWIVEFEQPER